jgi:hypothetical protein
MINDRAPAPSVCSAADREDNVMLEQKTLIASMPGWALACPH